MNDEILFGGIGTIIGSLISGVLLYFGATNAIMWLCVVGVIVAAVTLLFSLFAEPTNGLINLVILGLVVGFATLFRDTFLSWFSSENAFGAWLIGNGAMDFFYICRMIMMSMVVWIFMSIVRFNSGK